MHSQHPGRERDFGFFSEGEGLFNLLPTPVRLHALLLHPWQAPRCPHSPDNTWVITYCPCALPSPPPPQQEGLCWHLHPAPQQPWSSPALLRATSPARPRPHSGDFLDLVNFALVYRLPSLQPSAAAQFQFLLFLLLPSGPCYLPFLVILGRRESRK